MINPQQYRNAKNLAFACLEQGLQSETVLVIAEHLYDEVPSGMHPERFAAQIKSVLSGGTCRDDLREYQNFGFPDEVPGSISKSQWVDMLDWQKDLPSG